MSRLYGTEAKEWFEKVKGKKIRWSDWDNYMWIIPETLIGIRIMECLNHNGYRRTFSISNGFEPNVYGEYWIVVGCDDSDKTVPKGSIAYTYEIGSGASEGSMSSNAATVRGEQHKCNCDFTELLRYGCKCGGI
jgi:hypothetical protein